MSRAARSDAGTTPAAATGWIVYVLVSHDGQRTYVGITTSLSRRLAQHNGELPGGAKSTRAGRPWRVASSEGPFESRGEAQQVEHALKRRRGRDRLSRTAVGEASPRRAARHRAATEGAPAATDRTARARAKGRRGS